MSAEEDTELRDLVAKTLENNGVLAKIRAELRASVFLALEEQESSPPSFENKALKEYLKTQQAALGLCIVREFLEYLELDFTLSVYNTETSHGKGYEYSGRNKLMKDLQIQGLNGKKGPLLAHILQIAQEWNGVHADCKESPQVISNSKISPRESPQHNTSSELGTSLDSPNVTVAPLDRTFTSDGTTVKGLLSLSSNIDDKTKVAQLKQPPLSPEAPINVTGKQDIKLSGSLTRNNSQDANLKKTLINNENSHSGSSTSKTKSSDVISDRKQTLDGESSLQKVVKKEVKNPMSSLNDLPPIPDLQGRKFFNKASINLSGLALQDDYEEDFLSTDSSAAIVDEKSKSQSQKSSNKQAANKKEVQGGSKLFKGSLEKDASEKSANSPVGSISEDLDDNTNSGIDELLNSTASTENTVDNTISLIQSNFADYMEDL